ncbi:zf-TFIIB domain-containing protein [Lusitaniella coriacea LEGE 07157]|uniref:Zf-TFIIB domain-containing protein n=1 Tax=Lusitaniella coriacea LEGE 07157 TaxID=945747 RepID=A0A8J7DVC8_9CYAN|nr:zf-TFIIB domain-containing protein [Lusitaniella coriacea]MBE9115734.1 zf-TFIIB domain-containing protein [Lusitaniella coriacea LEGE 07157]
MSQLVCPKCRALLNPVVYAEIEVDRCPDCGGIWFDAQEAEDLKTIKGSESLDAGNPEIGEQFNEMEEDTPCPRCNVSLRGMLDIDRYSIWYEQCPQCRGMWLDAGEFKQFRQNFRPKTWRDRVKKFFRWKKKRSR